MSAQHDRLEPLLFERSRAGVSALSLPAAGVDDTPADCLPPDWHRQTPPHLPEVSQLEVVRHFLNLSQLNHCIDKAFYPLGSCTMKYNPKICDLGGLQEGFATLHPYTPDHLSQGALGVMHDVQTWLADLSGFDAVGLQPAAGAQGELVGMMIAKAYFQQIGEGHRNEVIIPDSAHGTNPASAAMCGFKVIEIKSGENGLVDLEQLRRAITDNTACLMLTNPSTLGLFEQDILTIAGLIHKAGGLMYYDGANLNAVMGKAQPARMGFDIMHINTHKTFATPHGGGGPGCGPVAVTARLAEFLPTPIVIHVGTQYCFDIDRPHSVGKVKAFYGNFDMVLRTWIYILAYGSDGLRQVSEEAVLNANYLRACLADTYDVAPVNAGVPCKHEFILTNARQKVLHPGLNTMALVKRLMDYGYHPPTVYFPLIIQEAMMIEPTETESKQTLDAFVSAMKAIARECEENPDLVLNAPHTTPVQRVDEVRAARKPDLNYFYS